MSVWGGSSKGGFENNDTLTGVAQWVGRHPAKQKVTGSIPGQGACLGYRQGPQLGACKRQPIDVSLAHQCFSPSLSPLPL